MTRQARGQPAMTIPPEAADRLRSGPVMIVDLAAVQANFRLLARRSAGRAAAVVKGDGYGHGMIACARALERAGARTFFAARLDDALALRRMLAPDTEVAALDGADGRSLAAAAGAGVVPVLNGPEQLEAALRLAAARGSRLRAFVHIDTGMNRLGFGPRDLDRLAAGIGALDVAAYMTHFAAADEGDIAFCRTQLRRFRAALRRLPPAPVSVANSCGLFLGRAFHGDLTRPGKATFGINPLPGDRNPMTEPATVLAPVVQVRDLRRGDPVGYGSAWRAPGRARIAVLAIGYANGYRRSAGNAGTVAFGGRTAPVVGRVSMDLTAVDVTGFPEGRIVPGSIAEIVGPSISYRTLARSEGTNEHEALIALGTGCPRVCVGSVPARADLPPDRDRETPPLPGQASTGEDR